MALHHIVLHGYSIKLSVEPYNPRKVERQGDIMATIKDFWQDKMNGSIYAIESDTFGKILGGAGPLDENDLHDLKDYDYNRAILEWLERAVKENRLHRINPT